MTSINPDILKWARETAGLSLEEAVQKLGIIAARGVEPVERLEQMEAGKVVPKRPMLEKMSKKYRRPLLSFYLSAPPHQGNRGQDFRTLPEVFAMTDNALVDAVVRDIRARQSLVRATLEEEDEAEALPFIGTADKTEQPSFLAIQIAEIIGFDRNTYRSCRNISDAVAYLRSQIETAGIFVLFIDNFGSHHTEIPVDMFRGFALADDVAPFVAVNANDSKGAQSFTMIHELVHLWLGLTGVSGKDGERDIEKFCNDVAGEFLLSTLELQTLDISEATSIAAAVQVIDAFARDRKVSGTMVAYKLHRNGVFDSAFYQGIVKTFRQNFLSQRGRARELGREANSGPTYPIIRRHRAGPALVQLVDRMLGTGALTTTKAGKVLGVSAKNVQSVLQAGGQRLPA